MGVIREMKKMKLYMSIEWVKINCCTYCYYNARCNDDGSMFNQ